MGSFTTLQRDYEPARSRFSNRCPHDPYLDLRCDAFWPDHTSRPLRAPEFRDPSAKGEVCRRMNTRLLRSRPFLEHSINSFNDRIIARPPNAAASLQLRRWLANWQRLPGTSCAPANLTLPTGSFQSTVLQQVSFGRAAVSHWKGLVQIHLSDWRRLLSRHSYLPFRHDSLSRWFDRAASPHGVGNGAIR